MQVQIVTHNKNPQTTGMLSHMCMHHAAFIHRLMLHTVLAYSTEKLSTQLKFSLLNKMEPQSEKGKHCCAQIWLLGQITQKYFLHSPETSAQNRILF